MTINTSSNATGRNAFRKFAIKLAPLLMMTSHSNLPLMSKEMVHDLKMKIAGDIEKQLSLSPATLNQPSGRDYERLLKLEQSLKDSLDSRTQLSDPSKWEWLEVDKDEDEQPKKGFISINKVL